MIVRKLTISVKPSGSEASDLWREIKAVPGIGRVEHYILNSVDPTAPSTVIASLGSAGAFIAAYRIICKWLEKDKDRQVHFRDAERFVTMKGHSLKEEKEILAILFPDGFHQEDE